MDLGNPSVMIPRIADPCALNRRNVLRGHPVA
jgi:hypothetical protein